jgi:hypothetical protein
MNREAASPTWYRKLFGALDSNLKIVPARPGSPDGVRHGSANYTNRPPCPSMFTVSTRMP